MKRIIFSASTALMLAITALPVMATPGQELDDLCGEPLRMAYNDAKAQLDSGKITRKRFQQRVDTARKKYEKCRKGFKQEQQKRDAEIERARAQRNREIDEAYKRLIERLKKIDDDHYAFDPTKDRDEWNRSRQGLDPKRQTAQADYDAAVNDAEHKFREKARQNGRQLPLTPYECEQLRKEIDDRYMAAIQNAAPDDYATVEADARAQQQQEIAKLEATRTECASVAARNATQSNGVVLRSGQPKTIFCPVTPPTESSTYTLQPKGKKKTPSEKNCTDELAAANAALQQKLDAYDNTLGSGLLTFVNKLKTIRDTAMQGMLAASQTYTETIEAILTNRELTDAMQLNARNTALSDRDNKIAGVVGDAEFAEDAAIQEIAGLRDTARAAAENPPQGNDQPTSGSSNVDQ